MGIVLRTLRLSLSAAVARIYYLISKEMHCGMKFENANRTYYFNMKYPNKSSLSISASASRFRSRSKALARAAA